MRTVGQIDVRGQLQLIGIALAVFAIWVLLLLTQPWSAHGAITGRYLVIVIAVSALVAGGAVGVQLWDWNRQGGRPVVAETESWIRAGAVPADVPRARWQPALQRRSARVGARWMQIGLGGLWIGILTSQAFTDTTAVDHLWQATFAAFWVAFIVWNLVEVTRRIPRIRRMETEAGRAAREREAVAVAVPSV